MDAGPLVAIVHRNDQDHGTCVAVLQRIRAPLLTTWMPITEAMHLLASSLEGQDSGHPSAGASATAASLRSAAPTARCLHH